MTIPAFVLGTTLPAVLGWLVLRLLERETPVLYRWERVSLAVVLGNTLTMFLFFLAEITGFLQFTLTNFLLVCTVGIIVLGLLYIRLSDYWTIQPSPHMQRPRLSGWAKILIGVLVAWTALKIVSAGVLLIGSPPYADDVFNNWNMRGKVFYQTQQLELNLEIGNEITSNAGVSSYPPTVPLTKTWLSAINGNWNEALANAPHLVWYVAALLLLFFFLYRHAGWLWAALGTYGLSSLPLFLMHGAIAYADIYLALHSFAALAALYNATRAETDDEVFSWLRLSGLAAALLVFTKNEALMMHLPAYLLLLALTLFRLRRDEVLSPRTLRQIVTHNAALLAITLLPWVTFKWMHDLPFGNAKSVESLERGWQTGVATTVWLNTFFEGNWNVFIPLFILLLIACRRRAFRSPLVLLTAYCLILLGGQLFLYFFTSLSTEALRQTGFARGIIQIVPVAVATGILLLEGLVNQSNPEGSV